MQRASMRHYWLQQASALGPGLTAEIARWNVVLKSQFGPKDVAAIARRTEREFRCLLPMVPYVGGEANPLSPSLIESVQALAFCRAVIASGAKSEEAGRFLYDAVFANRDDYVVRVPPAQWLAHEQLMERRRERARQSQQRRYSGDWVYEFVEGDGATFDYGYDFTACASLVFYRAVGAEALLPYYCFTDFPKCELAGLGLSRTTTLAEGHAKCDFRFKEGGRAAWHWPPPFVERP